AAWTQDDYIARDLAVKATRFARASLALGPFNNHWDKALLETQTQKTWYQNNTGKKGYSQIDGLVAASDDSEELGGPFRGRSPWTTLTRNLYAARPAAMTAEDLLFQQALLTRGVFTMKGGVCAQIAALTCGIMTTMCAKDARICIVWDGCDHN